MEEHSLAYEMLQELKRSNERLERINNNNSKKWFVIAIIELIVIVAIVIGFVMYESQYEYSDETYQYVEDTEMDNSMIDQKIGE